MQSIIDHAYLDFTSTAAAARKTTPENIDEVARAASGAARRRMERGLVDRTGSLGDALAAARTRAKLGDDARVSYVERDAGPLRPLRRVLRRLRGQALGRPRQAPG